MNHITDLWRQLVRRRLWPVALLLVAALAAVPMVLAKDPEPAPPAPPANSTQTADAALASDPIVVPGEAAAPGTDRRPLGARHDIFKPTKKPPKVKPAAKDEVKTEDKAEDPKPESGSGSKDSGSGGGSTPTPTTPAEPAPDPEPKTYPLYSLKVRFGAGEDEGGTRLVRRNAALPSAEAPLLIYLGLEDDRKTAVFLLDSTLSAIGDGKCAPTPENCETVRMRAGDTMFFDQVDEEGNPSGEQFQLDLLKIHTKRTTDAAKAARSARLASVTRASAAGRLHTGLGSVGRTG
jgi:hypothetical protein